jgi:hypothetical protein
MTEPRSTPEPLAFLDRGYPRAHVVAQRRPPWQETPPLPVRVAKTVVVVQGAGMVRAADAASPVLPRR